MSSNQRRQWPASGFLRARIRAAARRRGLCPIHQVVTYCFGNRLMNSDERRAKPNSTQLLAWFLLTLPPLFWAGNFVVGRAPRADVPPMMLAFARHFVALSFLLPFGWAAMRRDMKRYWECRWQLVRASLAGMVAFNLL